MAGRRAARQDAFPAIARDYGLAQDVEVLGDIHPVGCRHWPLRVFRKQHLSCSRPLAQRVNAAVSLAGISEGLAFCVVDLQQPLTPPGFVQPNGLAFAVVKNMGHLVHQEVIEAPRGVEVFCREVAGRLLAQSNKVGGIVGKDFCLDAGEKEVCQIPSRVEPSTLFEHLINRHRREKDHRTFEHVEDARLFVAGKESLNHGEYFPAGERGDIQFDRGRWSGGARGSLVDRRFQRLTQGRITVLDAAEVAVPWPCPEVHVVLTALQVTLDRLFRRLLHGTHREEGIGREGLTTNRV